MRPVAISLKPAKSCDIVASQPVKSLECHRQTKDRKVEVDLSCCRLKISLTTNHNISQLLVCMAVHNNSLFVVSVARSLATASEIFNVEKWRALEMCVSGSLKHHHSIDNIRVSSIDVQRWLWPCVISFPRGRISLFFITHLHSTLSLKGNFAVIFRIDKLHCKSKKLDPFIWTQLSQILRDVNNSFTVADRNYCSQTHKWLPTSPVVCCCTTLTISKRIHFFTKTVE